MSQKYADIIIDISHEAVDKIFQYLIPDSMSDEIVIGMVVEVPFGNGNHIRRGYVVGISDTSSYDVSRIKPIGNIADDSLSVGGRLIKLAAFIKDRYGCTMATALKTVMPVKKRTRVLSESMVTLNLSEKETGELLKEYNRKHCVARVRVLEMLSVRKTIGMKELMETCRVNTKLIKDMGNAGALIISENNVYRSSEKIKPADIADIILNDEQKHAACEIVTSMKQEKASVFLMHGVTGSGKTEVYVRAIKQAADMGRQTILLVPEINLTFQLVRYLKNYFGDRVAVMNSRMSDGEKYDIIRKFENNDADVVVGPRSALFVPVKRLGLIIVDEEHDASYVNDNIPRYNAIEVARERCRLENACLVLGSATPSLSSYYRTETGEYKLLRLPHRISSFGMAKTSIVDMRDEIRLGNRSMFSHALATEIRNALDNHRQVMLFINKRGYNSFVSCRSCGEVIKCPHCDVALKKHADNSLMCHYCGYKTEMPDRCPSCGSGLIGGYGSGTEKVEEQVNKLFPDAIVLRLDKDTGSRKNSGINILEKFAGGGADILIGTQMIVKGFDFPNVTLVGIMLADLTLFNNDYMAGERTFDLLTQAAGRAGRGDGQGKVIIQTYQPDNYIIKAASCQDYESFYKNEMAYRRLMGYPPASNMMVMTFASANTENLRYVSEQVGSDIRRILKKSNAVSVIGPAEPAIEKISDIYRRVIYFKSPEYNNLLYIKKLLEESIKRNRTLFEDIRVEFEFNPVHI